MIIYKERLSYKDQQKVEQYEKACREVKQEKLFYIILCIILVFVLSFIGYVSSFTFAT